jgi:hypothetical protein
LYSRIWLLTGRREAEVAAGIAVADEAARREVGGAVGEVSGRHGSVCGSYAATIERVTDSTKVALVTVEDEEAAASAAGEVPQEAGARPEEEEEEEEVAVVGGRASGEARRPLL